MFLLPERNQKIVKQWLKNGPKSISKSMAPDPPKREHSESEGFWGVSGTGAPPTSQS